MVRWVQVKSYIPIVHVAQASVAFCRERAASSTSLSTVHVREAALGADVAEDRETADRTGSKNELPPVGRAVHASSSTYCGKVQVTTARFVRTAVFTRNMRVLCTHGATVCESSARAEYGAIRCTENTANAESTRHDGCRQSTVHAERLLAAARRQGRGRAGSRCRLRA